MKTNYIIITLSVVLSSCNFGNVDISKKIIGKHEIKEVVMGTETKDLDKPTYLKIEQDGLLFIEDNSESEAFGDWKIDSTGKSVIFNINDGNFDVRLNLVEDNDSTLTLRGYTVDKPKMYFSFKLSK